MNWLGLIALVLSFVCFVLGKRVAQRNFGQGAEVFLIALFALFAVPAFIYAAYYSKLVGEPILLYRIRTITCSELLASPAGFLAGWMQVRAIPHLRVSEHGRKLLLPVLLAFGLMVPYLKPLLRPLPINDIPNDWDGTACLQSTPSTCGPAAAATIMHHFGRKVSERELAVESFTSSSGTENWYLARALRRRGMETSFLLGEPLNVQLPAIAGVRLLHAGNAGHFIALLSHENGKFVLSDSLEGLSTNTIAELRTQYEFTGFLMPIQPRRSSQ